MAGCGNRWAVGLIALQFLLPASVSLAQTQAPSETTQMQAPSPEALAAAKELLETMHLDQQFKAIVPSLFKNLKGGIVQGRADVERQYDALTPVMIEAFNQRVSEMADAAAIVYARTFTVEELHTLTEFYKTSAGQKMLQKFPVLTQELMAAGRKFGQSVGAEVQQRMIEELRKKGVNL
jgi:hypothetical protein